MQCDAFPLTFKRRGAEPRHELNGCQAMQFVTSVFLCVLCLFVAIDMAIEGGGLCGVVQRTP